jgi:hypothetical protein
MLIIDWAIEKYVIQTCYYMLINSWTTERYIHVI